MVIHFIRTLSARTRKTGRQFSRTRSLSSQLKRDRIKILLEKRLEPLREFASYYQLSKIKFSPQLLSSVSGLKSFRSMLVQARRDLNEYRTLQAHLQAGSSDTADRFRARVRNPDFHTNEYIRRLEILNKILEKEWRLREQWNRLCRLAENPKSKFSPLESARDSYRGIAITLAANRSRIEEMSRLPQPSARAHA